MQTSFTFFSLMSDTFWIYCWPIKWRSITASLSTDVMIKGFVHSLLLQMKNVREIIFCNSQRNKEAMLKTDTLERNQRLRSLRAKIICMWKDKTTGCCQHVKVLCFSCGPYPCVNDIYMYST
jgi:hypothetical protein